MHLRYTQASAILFLPYYLKVPKFQRRYRIIANANIFPQKTATGKCSRRVQAADNRANVTGLVESSKSLCEFLGLWQKNENPDGTQMMQIWQMNANFFKFAPHTNCLSTQQIIVMMKERTVADSQILNSKIYHTCFTVQKIAIFAL